MIDKTAIIVGGGPAGAACAWRLKKAGVDALILDKKTFPRLKLCAGWVTPKVFNLLGLHPKRYPHSIIAFDRLVCYFRGVRVPVRTRQYSIRRYEFDAWLLERSGAPMDQHRVGSIRKENRHHIIDDRYRAKYLVGAGGTHCPVYRHLFSRISPRPETSRIATVETELRYDYIDSNCYLWFFEDGLPGYAWYVPKGNGYLNIGIGGKQTAIKKQGRTINEYWRRFEQKLAAAGLVIDREFDAKGHIYYIRHRTPRLQTDNAYLTGDAAGLATVDMGEGIGPAIRSGLRAADAIIHKRPYRMPQGAGYSWPGIIGSGITAFFNPK
ncbi:MAG: NAD(P)/FAD-dependent oxidoreductase [Desulfobacterales bacterium]|nr:NAD(P)/FAD-dependent oxidoreductase [Desulfobacterales bacterium]